MATLTIEQYAQRITDKLVRQNPAWDSLRVAPIGKELIYYAATCVGDVSDIQDGIAKAIDLARTSLNGVISYAFTQGITVDMRRPSTVRVRLTSDINKGCPPYTLSLTKGGATYYNTSYVRALEGQEIVLYQGEAKTLVDTSDYTPYIFQVNNTPSVYSWSTVMSGKSPQSYIKLGPNAMSESVYVVRRTTDNMEFLISQSSPYNDGSDLQLYRLRVGWDKSMNVYFGDGLWGAMLDLSEKHAIYYLDGTIKDIGFKDQENLAYSRNVGVNYIVDVLDTEAGRDLSIEELILAIQAKMAEEQGLVTNRQIVSYVDAMPQVNSSKIVTNADKSLSVIVKPKIMGESKVGFISEALQYKSVIGTRISAQIGKTVLFNIELHKTQGSDGADMTSAVALLESEFAYNKLNINDEISAVRVNNMLREAGLTSVWAEVSIEVSLPNGVRIGDLISGGYYPGTLNFYKNNALIGFEDGTGNIVSVTSGGLVPVSSNISIYKQGKTLPAISDGSSNAPTDTMDAVSLGDFFIAGGYIYGFVGGTLTRKLFQDIFPGAVGGRVVVISTPDSSIIGVSMTDPGGDGVVVSSVKFNFYRRNEFFKEGRGSMFEGGSPILFRQVTIDLFSPSSETIGGRVLCGGICGNIERDTDRFGITLWWKSVGTDEGDLIIGFDDSRSSLGFYIYKANWNAQGGSTSALSSITPVWSEQYVDGGYYMPSKMSRLRESLYDLDSGVPCYVMEDYVEYDTLTSVSGQNGVKVHAVLGDSVTGQNAGYWGFDSQSVGNLILLGDDMTPGFGSLRNTEEPCYTGRLSLSRFNSSLFIELRSNGAHIVACQNNFATATGFPLIVTGINNADFQSGFRPASITDDVIHDRKIGGLYRTSYGAIFTVLNSPSTSNTPFVSIGRIYVDKVDNTGVYISYSEHTQVMDGETDIIGMVDRASGQITGVEPELQSADEMKYVALGIVSDTAGFVQLNEVITE